MIKIINICVYMDIYMDIYIYKDICMSIYMDTNKDIYSVDIHNGNFPALYQYYLS